MADERLLPGWGSLLKFSNRLRRRSHIEKKRLMMTILTVVLPLLPGKQEPWRRFCQALQGSRCFEYAAWRDQMGITQEEVWLSQTLQRDLVCVHLHVENPERVVTDLTVSPHPFERWLRQQLLQLHGPFHDPTSISFSS